MQDDLQRRVVVVSPHSDDAVLSLGAAMCSWARNGRRVELLTVFALDPGSAAKTRGWDLRAGFESEGEAAIARREEDRRACEALGVLPAAWLPFGSVDYERHGDEADVRDAVLERVGEARTVLLPGSPLTHPDHEWLVRVLADSLAGRLALYAEQPYTRRAGTLPSLPGWLEGELGPHSFDQVPVAARDRLAKRRAIGCYTSQLPLLAMVGTVRRGPLALALAPEAVAWVGDRGPV